MKEELEEIFLMLDRLFINCDIDYNDLQSVTIDVSFFEEYNSIRIINSFLFNYTKIQDKIGAKLFKKFLYVINETDTLDLPMIDVLNMLEKLDILHKDDWEKLRNIRNMLTHEYPYSIDERIENIQITLAGYENLKLIYSHIKNHYIKYEDKI